MKKILNISAVAVLVALPTLAFADPTPNYQGGSETTVDTVAPYALSADAANDGTNVVTASYVKGAYNDAIRKINTVAANAASNATSQITDAAGNGLAGANGKLSVDMTTNGGLELSGSTEGSKTLGVKTDGTTITKTNEGALQVNAIAESQVTGLETDLAAKQVQLVNDASTPADVDETVYTELKALDAATGAPDDTHLATSKAIRTAINNIASDAMTLTNKSFNANGTGNSISNLETEDFASGVIVTSIDTDADAQHATSDSKIPTEKAVRSAITSAVTAATTDADMVTEDGTQTLTNKTIDGDNNTIQDLSASVFKSGVVQTTVRTAAAIETAGTGDNTLVSEKAVRTALDNQRINILSNWADPTNVSQISLTTPSN